MSKTGPIVLIEDDHDDKMVFEEILKDLGVENKLKWFEDTDTAMEFLKESNESVFAIFSDINLPGINGLEFKKKIDSNPELRKKSIPYIFYSTSASQRDVNEAYLEMTVQGFFKKQSDYKEIKKQISIIIEYWKMCIHPNTQ